MPGAGHRPDGRPDPRRAAGAIEDRAEGRDGVRALDVQPADVVRPGDRLDRRDRIVRGHDAGVAGPVLDRARVEAHDDVIGRRAVDPEGHADGLVQVALVAPGRVDVGREVDRPEQGDPDHPADEDPAGRLGVPARPVPGDPGDEGHDRLERQQVGLRREGGAGVDERPVRHVDGRDEAGEREEQAGVEEERQEVGRVAAQPGAGNHERGEDDPRHQHAEDDDRLEEAGDPAGDQRADPLAEERGAGSACR